MINPFTVVDVRSHTLFEEYGYDNQTDAIQAFKSMANAAIDGNQTRIVNLYQDAILIKTFTTVDLSFNAKLR
jgi:hypothetical protein